MGADTDPKGLKKSLNLTDDIANKYHIEFGEKKSKAMIINEKKDTPRPTFSVGGMQLEYVDKYKYLGEMINSKNNVFFISEFKE